jgi:hypothetical protein
MSISAVLNPDQGNKSMDVDGEAATCTEYSRQSSPMEVDTVEMEPECSLAPEAVNIAMCGPSKEKKCWFIFGEARGVKRVREEKEEEASLRAPKKGKKEKTVRKADAAAKPSTTKAKLKSKNRSRKSTTWDRLQKVKYNSFLQDGKFISNKDDVRTTKFKEKLMQWDQKVMVVDPKQVIHFKCGKTLRMKVPWNTWNFKTHIVICKGPSKGTKLPRSGMSSISTYFQPSASCSSMLMDKKTSLSCPGLPASEHEDVAHYLECTGSLGGGGPSLYSVALDLYSKPFSQLSHGRQDQVRLTQCCEWAWMNNTINSVVFSTACTKVAGLRSTVARPLPCVKCNALLSAKRFKVLLKIPTPAPENYKYLNKVYQNSQLALVYSKCTGVDDVFEEVKVSAQSESIQGCLATLLSFNLCRKKDTHHWLATSAPLSTVRTTAQNSSSRFSKRPMSSNNI